MSRIPVQLPPEDDAGDTEYKLVVAGDPLRVEGLVTQMRGRLCDGRGRAVYWIGVLDSGKMVGVSRTALDASVHNLVAVARKAGAVVVSVDTAPAVADLTDIRNAHELEPHVPATGQRFVARAVVTAPLRSAPLDFDVDAPAVAAPV